MTKTVSHVKIWVEKLPSKGDSNDLEGEVAFCICCISNMEVTLFCLVAVFLTLGFYDYPFE